MKRKVDVTLLGRRFAVRTEKDEAYVHDLAAHVGSRIEELRKQLRSASREELALLVALDIADELFEAAQRSASSRAEVRRHTESMIGKLAEALGRPSDHDAHEAPADAIAPAPTHGLALEDDTVLVLAQASQRRA